LRDITDIHSAQLRWNGTIRKDEDCNWVLRLNAVFSLRCLESSSRAWNVSWIAFISFRYRCGVTLAPHMEERKDGHTWDIISLSIWYNYVSLFPWGCSVISASHTQERSGMDSPGMSSASPSGMATSVPCRFPTPAV
jgi:hypothetical protein